MKILVSHSGTMKTSGHMFGRNPLINSVAVAYILCSYHKLISNDNNVEKKYKDVFWPAVELILPL